MTGIIIPDKINPLTPLEEYTLFVKYFSARIIYKSKRDYGLNFFEISKSYFINFEECNKHAWNELRKWIRSRFKETPKILEEIVNSKIDKNNRSEIRFRKNIFLMASFAFVEHSLNTHATPKLILRQGLCAYQDLVKHNIYLVLSHVSKSSVDPSYFYDAFQDGTIGLMVAITRFRPWLGIRLSTYATYYIIERIKTCYFNFFKGNSGFISFQEDISGVQNTDDPALRIDSIDISMQISDCLAYLNEKYKHVVLARYLERKNFSEIASEIGLSRERVRQIHNHAVEIIRDYCDKNGISIL